MDDAGPSSTTARPNAVSIERLGPLNLQTLRMIDVSDAALEAASTALGFTLPSAPLIWSLGPPPAARVGPREWILRNAAAELIDARLSGVVHRVDETGAGRAGWRVSGASAADLIASGCSLDLHPSVFSERSCARTLLASAGVVITRLPHGAFELIADVSVADYLEAWLHDAEMGFTN